MRALIFSTLKPGTGLAGIQQTNAVGSWIKLGLEVALFGSESGTATLAQKVGAHHFASVRTNEYGTPLLSDMFEQARDRFDQCDVFIYCNGDIILTPAFVQSAAKAAQEHKQFQMIGRRWNLDLAEFVDYTSDAWLGEIESAVRESAILGGIGALDYFVFSHAAFPDMPDMAVGRAGWDNWMVGQALERGIPLLNASFAAPVIHQNHEYGHLQGGRWRVFSGPEALSNRRLRKGTKAGNCADATLWPAVGERPLISVVFPEGCQPAALEALGQQENIEVVPVPGITKDIASAATVASWNQGLSRAQGKTVLFVQGNEELDLIALLRAADQLAKAEGHCEWLLCNSEAQGRRTDIQILDTALTGREGIGGIHPWLSKEILNQIQAASTLFSTHWLRRCGPFDTTLDSGSALLERLMFCSSKGGVGRTSPVVSCRFTGPGWRSNQQGRADLLHRYLSYGHTPEYLRVLRDQPPPQPLTSADAA
tara:strand:+ start:5308 stop:6750 length:1443 start_codon:yes stop_codon:yes gene_type:complete